MPRSSGAGPSAGAMVVASAVRQALTKPEDAELRDLSPGELQTFAERVAALATAAAKILGFAKAENNNKQGERKERKISAKKQ